MKYFKKFEGLIKTYDYNIIIKLLNNLLVKYNENDSNIRQSAQGIYARFSKKFIKKSYLDILNILKVCGYVISSYSYDEKKRINKQPENNNILSDIYTYINFTLIKKFDIENIDNIDNLYHVTDKKNIKNILKNGLIPKSNNKIESHPDRIYLMSNLTGANHYLRLLEDKYGDYSGDRFIILKINKKLINIKLYYDPMYLRSEKNVEVSGFDAFYTYDNISPDSIELLTIDY